MKITDEVVEAATNALMVTQGDNRDIKEKAVYILEAALPFSRVRVKPLEWFSEPPYHVARVFGGHYSIELHEHGACLRGTFGRGEFGFLGEAKAAAQADYERRILSAIEPTQAPTHRHKKRGTDYVLIGIGKMQAEYWYLPGAMEAGPSVDMQEVVIYHKADDPTELWVRPREDFEDGRFEALGETEAET